MPSFSSRRDSSSAGSAASSARVMRLLGIGIDATGDVVGFEEPSVAAVHRAMRPIRALVFDLEDVLFDATDWRRWLIQFLRRFGLHAEYRCLFELWDRDYLGDVHRGSREFDAAFVAFLRDAGILAGQVDEVVAASNHYRRRADAERRPFPLVCETLTRLHGAGYRLAVLADSESTGIDLHRSLERMGIGSVFCEVASSIDLKCTKPDPTGYRTVLERIEASPSQAAFVGRNREALHGARACGLTTIAFNAEWNVRSDFRLRRFDELPHWFTRGDELRLPKAA